MPCLVTWAFSYKFDLFFRSLLYLLYNIGWKIFVFRYHTFVDTTSISLAKMWLMKTLLTFHAFVINKGPYPLWIRQSNYDVDFQMYLAQYGYLNPSVKNPSSGHIMDENSWRRAIAEFQSFAGLNTTGNFFIIIKNFNATFTLMQTISLIYVASNR